MTSFKLFRHIFWFVNLTKIASLTIISLIDVWFRKFQDCWILIAGHFGVTDISTTAKAVSLPQVS